MGFLSPAVTALFKLSKLCVWLLACVAGGRPAMAHFCAVAKCKVLALHQIKCISLHLRMDQRAALVSGQGPSLPCQAEQGVHLSVLGDWCHFRVVVKHSHEITCVKKYSAGSVRQAPLRSLQMCYFGRVFILCTPYSDKTAIDVIFSIMLLLFEIISIHLVQIKLIISISMTDSPYGLILEFSL